MRLWIFADFALPKEGHLKLYRDLGFTDVVLGVTTNKSCFQLNFTQAAWINACDLVRKYEMKPHVMSWCLPSEEYMKDLFKEFYIWKPRGGVSSILLDAEGTYHQGQLVDRAAAVEVVRHEAAKKSIDIGVTGLDNLHKTVAPLADVCDYSFPQAYSFWKPDDDGHWSHSEHTFPGRQQERAFASW